ncbi:MAG TPA: PD-(D/E)XK nuclease family protein [Gaiellaceae bacterium]|nr:PD-(D/E)XK nuclease family protein [Gaiellaceae bacterium]
MALALLVGPANAGKVARLLDRYLDALDRDPILIVPNRADVDRVELDLLARRKALLGGTIGTFDDLFRRIGERARAGSRRQVTDVQRSLLLARIVSRARLNGLGASARYAGFAEALGSAIADLEAALLEPAELEGSLGDLFRAYRSELDRLGLWDRELVRGHAADLVAGDFDAWGSAPVFAYGFEDLTGAQWRVLEALAGRTEVAVSLPYEPLRPAFASLQRTADDLARLASDDVEALPARDWYESPALGHLERTLFEERRIDPPPLEGAVRFLEAAGSRAALELAGEEILALIRGGTPAEEIAVVAPSLDRVRSPLETAFGSLGIPYAYEGRLSLRRTSFGAALLGLLRFAWLGGGRRSLFAFLRSPYSGLARPRADFVEGRLRGRAVTEPARVVEEAERLLGHAIPALRNLEAAEDRVAAAQALVRGMLEAAYGLESPPVGEASRLDLRAHEAALALLAELEGWRELEGDLTEEQIVSSLERAQVRVGSAREPGRIAVVDLMRARTRRWQAIFVLGLEEGVFPRRSLETPFLPDEARRDLEAAGRGRRLVRPDPLARERYFFYTACTRAWRHLFLVREASDDDGRPLEPSPFYEEVRSRFDPADVALATKRRPLSSLSWELERGPTERERLRAAAAIAATDEAEARALALANGWERRIERALAAFDRQTRLAHPLVLGELSQRARFSVTELERFLDCSSMWFFERVIDPKEIDAVLDPRVRGAIAHQTLYRFYSGLPKRLGTDAVEPERLEEALVFLRECLAEAIAGGVRIELTDVERLELHETLGRDLEHFVRQELELGLPLVPRRFEVAFGTSSAPVELQRGLELGGFTVSGKIDRIDVDPFSARGIVQDYKLGRAHGARDIETEERLQVPFYILALRDLVGIEPLGGLYRGLTGTREARGLVRVEARDEAVPGLKRPDYLAEDEFWAQVDGAQSRARGAVDRVHAGDVRTDPRGGDCPRWCSLWTMCRVRRA